MPRQSRRIAGALCVKGTDLLREVQVGFHLAPADETGEALAAAVDPAGEFAPDGGVFGVRLYLAEQGGAGKVAGADVIGEGEQGVELMLGDRESVGHPAESSRPRAKERLSSKMRMS